MKKYIKLNESDIKGIVKLVLLKEQEDEWVKVTPERYEELMKYAGYFPPGIANLPEYRGKKIRITGRLNLKGTPTKSLDGIKQIDGGLDISDTKVSSVDGIIINGYVSDWNTPLRKIKQKRIRDKKIADANLRREDDEWRLDTGYGRADKESYAAHAVLEHILENNRNLKRMTDNDSARLVELNEILENLQKKEQEYEEQEKDLTDIHADIEATEEEIEEIGNRVDIYHLIPDGEHYDIPKFEVIGIEDLEGEVYCAGKPQEFEDAAYEYVRDQVNSEGYSFFNRNFVEDYIDADEVADYFRDHYETDVDENPDVYFDDNDYELSDEQESRIEEIDAKIAELEKRQNNIENEVEDASEVSDLYDEIQEQIDELESEKEDIENSAKEVTQEMIDNKVEELLKDVKNDPVNTLREMGIDDYSNFINERDFIRGVVDSDGIGIINSYDDSYDAVLVNGEEFYVMRLN